MYSLKILKFWSGNNPAIAITLRYNRIDNFAFTVMHEIGHIDLHLRNNKEKSFLDLTTNDKPDTYESEADSFAQEKLISKECWNEALSNSFPLKDDKLIELGERYNINPAIFLGRVCFEKNHYALKTKIDKTLK